MPDFAPYNYSQDMPQMGQSLNQFNTGLVTGANQFTANIQQQQQQLQLQQMKNMQGDLQNLYQNPTPQNIAAMAFKYPQMASNFKQSFDMMTTAQRQDALDKSIPVYAMLQNGNVNGALQILQQYKVAYDNSGQTDKAQGVQNMISLLQSNPGAAKAHAGIMLASAMGPENFASSLGTIGANNRADELQPSAVAKANNEATITGAEAQAAPAKFQLANSATAAQTAATYAKIGLDADTLKTNTDLKLQEMNNKYGPQSEAVSKVTTPAMQDSVAADGLSKRFNDIADQAEALNSWSGTPGAFAEKWKQFWGDQNQISVVKQQYQLMRSQALAASLPPQVKRLAGPEMKVFNNGFPDENANPATIATFMRGMAIVKQSEALTQEATANWMGANRTLLPARSEMNVNGITVQKGMSLRDFTSQYVTKGIQTFKQNSVNNKVANSQLAPFLQPSGTPAQGGNPSMQPAAPTANSAYPPAPAMGSGQ